MRRLTACLVVLAVGLGACGGGDDGGGGGEQGASSGTCPDGSAEIKMVDIKFDPADATADAGQDICWINEDSIDHNVVAESGASFESELFGKGETFSQTRWIWG